MTRYELLVQTERQIPMGTVEAILDTIGDVINVFPHVTYLFTVVDGENGLITTSYDIGTAEGEIRQAAMNLGIYEPLVDPATLIALALIAAIGIVIGIIIWQLKEIGGSTLLYSIVAVVGIGSAASLITSIRR